FAALSTWHSGGGKNSAAGPPGQLRTAHRTKSCRAVRYYGYESVRPGIAINQLEQSICFCSSSDTRVSFLSQENFSCSQKIKFIFFLSILKRVCSLKPACEDGNKAHVNKL